MFDPRESNNRAKQPFFLSRTSTRNRSLSVQSGILDTLNICSAKPDRRGVHRSMSSSPTRAPMRQNILPQKETDAIIDGIKNDFLPRMENARSKLELQRDLIDIGTQVDTIELHKYIQRIQEQNSVIVELKTLIESRSEELDHLRKVITSQSNRIYSPNSPSYGTTTPVAQQFNSIADIPVKVTYVQPTIHGSVRKNTITGTSFVSSSDHSLSTGMPSTENRNLSSSPRMNTLSKNGGLNHLPLTEIHEQARPSKGTNRAVTSLVRPRFSFVSP